MSRSLSRFGQRTIDGWCDQRNSCRLHSNSREIIMGHEKAMLFIGANRPIPGRENEAMNLCMETGAWLDSQKTAGYFTRWDGFWLTPHGGDMNSAFVCYGDRAKLDEWRRTDAFEAWVFRAGSC